MHLLKAVSRANDCTLDKLRIAVLAFVSFQLRTATSRFSRV